MIRAAYDRDPGYGRSLGWIAPDLTDAGLNIIEDRSDGVIRYRTWAGMVDGATFARLADAWRLEGKPHDRALHLETTAGDRAMRAYTFDGMNWERGGQSPIIYVSLLVSAQENSTHRREMIGHTPVKR